MTLHGMDAQIAAVRAAVAGDRVHHAWLLAGPVGIGKATFASWAAALLLDAEDPASAGARLLAAGSHPDFVHLTRLPNEKTEKLARSITVDQVRAMRQRLTSSTAIAARRVILIDSADDLEGHGGPNALLKSLEEPPSGTIFLLVSHRPGSLLPTIRSRCRVLPFRPLDSAAMAHVLEDHLPDIDADERTRLIAAADGAPSKAIALSQLDIGAIDAALAAIARSGDASNAIRSSLSQTLSTKAAQPRYEAFLDRAPRMIADHARGADGRTLETALAAWAKARDIAQIAISQSLVPETVVFEIAGLVATLARTGTPAKG